MRTFTEEELTQAIVDAFDAGALHGVSWGRLEEMPHIDERRHIAKNECYDMLSGILRNQSEKQS